jgi:hypothetical protein
LKDIPLVSIDQFNWVINRWTKLNIKPKTLRRPLRAQHRALNLVFNDAKVLKTYPKSGYKS